VQWRRLLGLVANTFLIISGETNSIAALSIPNMQQQLFNPDFDFNPTCSTCSELTALLAMNCTCVFLSITSDILIPQRCRTAWRYRRHMLQVPPRCLL
jgi:hypothetical protein